MQENRANSTQIYAISDGRAGNARQAEAMGGALADDVTAFTLEPHPPWRWTAPRRWPGAERGYGDAFAALLDAPPAVAIGCGRQAALATRLLRERGTKAVQILDPRLDPKHWDFVIVPEHDPLRGPNVITTLGSLHPIDDVWLARARSEFAAFAELPRPVNVVLLGGKSRHARFDRMAFEVLASKLEAVLAREGGSVLLTTSRRTSKELRDVLEHRYDGTPGMVWRNSSDGPNPYAGLLAWADRIVCSPDSVNMITEACATRVPVFVFDPGRVRGRPRAFLDTLLDRGRIRAMDARLDAFDIEPLRETARVASVLRERLGII
ncbi:MAG: mitochondrial fission ELM1 family protein [Xanthomonadales bacterium]|nr:mitochondrial fission ELM1 family protein [Xanthomonadales bacterium]